MICSQGLTLNFAFRWWSRRRRHSRTGTVSYSCRGRGGYLRGRSSCCRWRRLRHVVSLPSPHVHFFFQSDHLCRKLRCSRRHSLRGWRRCRCCRHVERMGNTRLCWCEETKIRIYVLQNSLRILVRRLGWARLGEHNFEYFVYMTWNRDHYQIIDRNNCHILSKSLWHIFTSK